MKAKADHKLFLEQPLSLDYPDLGFGWGGVPGAQFGAPSYSLFPQFYQFSCPQAEDIAMSVLEKAIAKGPRMAASLLSFHFHDCFVQVTLRRIRVVGDSATIVSEKNSLPNRNSIRGFEVIDEIKAKLEEACPQTVSCAGILALAAHGSTVLVSMQKLQVDSALLCFSPVLLTKISSYVETERWTILGASTWKERLKDG
ncbi:hypothetical protein CRYUN_Cryun28dG0100000 [Craigia yunnanensis]